VRSAGGGVFVHSEERGLVFDCGGGKRITLSHSDTPVVSRELHGSALSGRLFRAVSNDRAGHLVARELPRKKDPTRDVQ